jgi:hypothetical protein
LKIIDLNANLDIGVKFKINFQLFPVPVIGLLFSENDSSLFGFDFGWMHLGGEISFVLKNIGKIQKDLGIPFPVEI